MNKGIIFNIRRFSVNDGPGIRTTVFFKGCPLSCIWCHNPESRQPEIITCARTNMLNGKFFRVNETIGREVTIDEVAGEVFRDKTYYETSGGGVTFSGGEPLFQPGFLKDLLIRFRMENISTAIDTTGFIPGEIFEEVISLADIFLYDIKLADEGKHIEYTGVPNKLIYQNLIRLVKSDKRIWIRIPLIPGITDTRENTSEIIKLLFPFRSRIETVSLLPWHKTGFSKYARLGMRNMMENAGDPERTTEEIIAEFQEKHFPVRSGG